LCVFAETVRESALPNPVATVQIQAHSSRALAEMEKIAAEVELAVPSARVAMAHRTGELAAGEVTVVCAASAPTGFDAFRACRAAIDRVRTRVPLWKRVHDPHSGSWVDWEDARGENDRVKGDETR
jgi:molybdopterin synthase catalytic subunit